MYIITQSRPKRLFHHCLQIVGNRHTRGYHQYSIYFVNQLICTRKFVMFVRQVIGWLFLAGISENQERSAFSRVNSDQAKVFGYRLI